MKKSKKPRSARKTKPRMVRYTESEVFKLPVYFDRAKVESTTDEEIARQIAADPDTAPDMTTLPESWRLPLGIRRKLGMTQEQIARVLRISIGTWRNWEQGRSAPYGPAAALLRVLEKNPEAVLRALR
ncbi:MAG TPA: helix-turn-helix domain-containing protein [Alphaproteobacteria bacterium]|nr:helix-turn-helix domain-containing protein [Alphaproteobacteria bacterium]